MAEVSLECDAQGFTKRSVKASTGMDEKVDALVTVSMMLRETLISFQ